MRIQQVGVNDLKDAPAGLVRTVDRTMRLSAHWPDPSHEYVIHYAACDCDHCASQPDKPLTDAALISMST